MDSTPRSIVTGAALTASSVIASISACALDRACRRLVAAPEAGWCCADRSSFHIDFTGRTTHAGNAAHLITVSVNRGRAVN